MNIDYSMASPSMAHVYGNVTSFVTEYIKQLFPDKFKTVYVNTTIAYRNFAKFNYTTDEFIKKRKPMLVVRPRVELDNNDAFLSGTLFTTRITDVVNAREWGNLQEFFSDKRKGLYMKFLMNRLTMDFDVSLIFETQMQQINYVHYFKNRIRQNAPFVVTSNLESMISRDMIVLLGELAGIQPVDDDNLNVPRILDYVNRHSMYPITYKMKNSTGRDEFFRYHPAGIEMTITGLSVDDGSKTGQISDNFTINFTVRTEFSTAGLYYLFSGKKEISDKYRYLYTTDELNHGTILPMFTSKNLFDIHVPDGWNLYMCPTFSIEHTDPKPYILSVEQIFNTSLQECANYHKRYNIPFDVFLDIKCLKDNRLMNKERREYEILTVDNELSIKVYNWNPASTYRLLVSVNTSYINDLIARICDIGEEK